MAPKSRRAPRLPDDAAGTAKLYERIVYITCQVYSTVSLHAVSPELSDVASSHNMTPRVPQYMNGKYLAVSSLYVLYACNVTTPDNNPPARSCQTPRDQSPVTSHLNCQQPYGQSTTLEINFALSHGWNHLLGASRQGTSPRTRSSSPARPSHAKGYTETCVRCLSP